MRSPHTFTGGGTDPVLAQLRARGLRITPQRRAIVQALGGDATHPSAQAIYERLRPEHPTMSFNTVYTTLWTLVESGVLRQMAFDGGRSRFDPNLAAHHHAVCTRCGAVRDVEPPDNGPGRNKPARIAGYRVEQVEWIYRGLCPACQK